MILLRALFIGIAVTFVLRSSSSATQSPPSANELIAQNRQAIENLETEYYSLEWPAQPPERFTKIYQRGATRRCWDRGPYRSGTHSVTADTVALVTEECSVLWAFGMPPVKVFEHDNTRQIAPEEDVELGRWRGDELLSVLPQGARSILQVDESEGEWHVEERGAKYILSRWVGGVGSGWKSFEFELDPQLDCAVTRLLAFVGKGQALKQWEIEYEKRGAAVVPITLKRTMFAVDPSKSQVIGFRVVEAKFNPTLEPELFEIGGLGIPDGTYMVRYPVDREPETGYYSKGQFVPEGVWLDRLRNRSDTTHSPATRSEPTTSANAAEFAKLAPRNNDRLPSLLIATVTSASVLLALILWRALRRG
jgi:hypothetical protein